MNIKGQTPAAVRLVPFSEAHITPTYLSWLNDKTLMRFSRQRLVTHTIESSHHFLSTFRDSPHFFWAIERVANGKQIGTLTTYVDPYHRTADLGILVGPEAAGCGCGKTAWGLALRHGFAVLGLRKITGGTSANNLGMTRIFKHWHMKQEGTLRAQELLADGPADVLLYGLLETEWKDLGC